MTKKTDERTPFQKWLDEAPRDSIDGAGLRVLANRLFEIFHGQSGTEEQRDQMLIDGSFVVGVTCAVLMQLADEKDGVVPL